VGLGLASAWNVRFAPYTVYWHYFKLMWDWALPELNFHGPECASQLWPLFFLWNLASILCSTLIFCEILILSLSHVYFFVLILDWRNWRQPEAAWKFCCASIIALWKLWGTSLVLVFIVCKMQICGSFVEYICFSGKKESENCRQKLTDSLKYAKSIAQLTPELKKEFLEVCVRKKFSMNFISCFDIVLQ